MAVILCAAAAALIYLWNVPLCLALVVLWRDGPQAGAALMPFDAAAARRRAARAVKRVGRKKRRGGTNARAALRILRLSRARISLAGRLCLGDAAATALACGGLNALGRALSGPLPGLSVSLEPDFGDSPGFEARGMIAARAGNIIAAAARVGAEEIVRRMPSWKSVPSKRSCPRPWRACGT